MRHLAICGVLCLLAGCGGQTGIDDGLDGLHGGGSGGSELTAAGGSGTGAGTSARGRRQCRPRHRRHGRG